MVLLGPDDLVPGGLHLLALLDHLVPDLVLDVELHPVHLLRLVAEGGLGHGGQGGGGVLVPGLVHISSLGGFISLSSSGLLSGGSGLGGSLNCLHGGDVLLVLE